MKLYEKLSVTKRARTAVPKCNKVLIMLDDCMGDAEFGSKVFERLASRGRHYMITAWITCQHYPKMQPESSKRTSLGSGANPADFDPLREIGMDRGKKLRERRLQAMTDAKTFTAEKEAAHVELEAVGILHDL